MAVRRRSSGDGGASLKLELEEGQKGGVDVGLALRPENQSQDSQRMHYE